MTPDERHGQLLFLRATGTGRVHVQASPVDQDRLYRDHVERLGIPWTDPVHPLAMLLHRWVLCGYGAPVDHSGGDRPHCLAPVTVFADADLCGSCHGHLMRTGDGHRAFTHPEPDDEETAS